MYKRYKTTTGHRYTMRISEDEIHERRLFHLALVAFPVLLIFCFALAAGVIV